MSFDWQKTSLVSAAKRYQGQFIDGLITVILFLPGIYLAQNYLTNGTFANVVPLLFPLAYFLFSDGLPQGQSLGKKIIGICVVNKKTGQACSYWASFLRNGPSLILGAIDAILILTRRRQRLGDIFANTIVIYGKPKF